jgi:hypothetical protein
MDVLSHSLLGNFNLSAEPGRGRYKRTIHGQVILVTPNLTSVVKIFSHPREQFAYDM